MKLKKDLVQLVHSDYVPLRTDQEGQLRGGFGSVDVYIQAESLTINVPNCSCNKVCNTCTPTTSPSATPQSNS